MTYAKEITRIVKKIENEVSRGKIYENQGVKEYRAFVDKVRSDDSLHYSEWVELARELREKLDSISYARK